MARKRPGRKDLAGSPLVPGLPVDDHDEELIDEALVETFPASDPVSVPAPKRPAKRSTNSTKRPKAR